VLELSGGTANVRYVSVRIYNKIMCVACFVLDYNLLY
jgi:hypothetical protein